MSPSELIAQALNKKTSVAQASESKKAALGAQDFYNVAAGQMNGTSGLPSASPVEADVRTMSPAQLWGKHGAEAMNLISGVAQGNRDFGNDVTSERTLPQAVGDSAIAVGQGLVNSIGGIGALAAGIVSPELGAGAAGLLQSGNDWATGLQSDALSNRRRAMAGRNAMDFRDNQYQLAQDLQVDGDFVGSLKRIGRDAFDAVGNALDDGAIMSDGIAQGVGSLLAGGALAKGLRAGAGAVLPSSLQAAVGQAALPVAIGAMEGGGAYTGTNQEVMKMTHEQLLSSSQPYRNAIEEGLTPRQAQVRVANQSALTAAAIQAPIGVATGSLVSRFEGNPFSSASLRNVFGNIGRETIEEGIQSASGQSAQNVGLKAFANSEQVLSEGVGEQAGLGALYGAGTAGALQLPTAAKQIVKAGGKQALNAVGAASSSLDKRLSRLNEKNEKASPIGDEAIGAAAQELNAATPVVTEAVQAAVDQVEATPEQKIEASDFINRITNAWTIPEEDSAQLAQAIPDVFADSPDRVTAIQRMTLRFMDAKTPQEMEQSLGLMYLLLEPIRDLQNTENEVLSKIPSNSPAGQFLSSYTKLIANIDNMSTVRRGLDYIRSQQMELPPVESEQIDTPEGKDRINATIAVASLAPEKSNIAANEMILKHAAEGRLELSPKRFAALKVSTAILKAQVALAQQLQQQGAETAADIVSNEVMSDTKDPGNKQAKSAWQHTQMVVQMMRADRVGDAADMLQDFQQFVQHMQNKLGAVNASYESGGTPQAHNAIDPGKTEWYESKPYVIYPGNDSSVGFAQRVGNEALLLTEVYNGLTEAFPELGATKLPVPSLVPSLQGNAKEIAAANRLNQQAAKRAAQTQAQPQVQEPTTPVEAATEAPVVEEAPAPKNSKMDQRLYDIVVKENYGTLETPAAVLSFTQAAKSSIDRIAAIPEDERTEEQGALLYKLREIFRKGGAEFDWQMLFDGMQPTQEQTEALNVLVGNEIVPAPVVEPVQETQPEPVAEVQQEPTPEIEAVDTVVEPAATTPFRNLFPDLIPSTKMEEAFRVPEEPTTNIVGSGSPLSVIRETLSKIGEFGSRQMTAETISAYRTLLTDVASDLQTTMNDRLQTFLKQKDGAVYKAFTEGKPVNRWLAGKALNITEQTEDSLVYNQELQEAGILAAIDWAINSTQGTSIMDESDIETLAGVSVDVLSGDDIEALSQGYSVEQVKRAIASKITRYWGMRPNASVDMAYSDGIAEALAAELMVAMLANGMLERTSVQLNETHGLTQPKTIFRYVVPRIDNDALHAFPDAIERSVMIEPEERQYFGDAMPPVPRTQMNNPDVETTQAEREAVKNESATPYFADTSMINLIASMGEEGVLSLFGSEITDTMNEQHRMSAEGANRNFSSAYQQLFDQLAQMENVGDVATMPVRYAYGVTRVGRMQMLGKYNPQANKLMREAFLPTWSTLDLDSNQDHKTAFGLATAQAFGIKIHNKGIDASVGEVNQKIEALATSVDILNNWMALTSMNSFTEATVNLTTAELAALRQNFKEAGVDMSMHALHALVENVRLQRMTDKSEFRTSLYLEADGVTNGPINAMMLFTPGEFTQDWLKNVAKGGVAFGAKTRMDQQRSTDRVDLYEESTNRAKEEITAQEQTYSPDVKEVSHHLKTLLSILNVDVKYEDGKLEMSRGIAKNPLTITLYGSSANGIAAKVVKGMTEVIYERLSEVAKSPDNAAQAFGLTPEKYEQLQDALAVMVGVEIRTTKINGETVFVADTTGVTWGNFNDPQNFKLGTEQLRILNNNMLRLFVQPMRRGIESTVGTGLMEAVTVMRKATQAQSIMLSNMFDVRVKEAMDAKKDDPEWRAGDFLSQKELNGIMKDLLKMFPLVQTGNQSFLLAKSHTSEQADVAYSRALMGSKEFGALETAPNYYAPANASVAAIPFMTIGMGDGRMMQILAQQNLPGTMKIFDGMNMPLDKINDYSVAANKAAYEAMMGNPLQAVLESNTGFIARGLDTMTDAQIDAMLYDEAGNELDLAKTLFSRSELKAAKESGDLINANLVRLAVATLHAQLSALSDEVQARHEVMQEVAMSVDHMAAAGQPYTNTNQTFDAPIPVEETVQQLNARLAEKLAEVKARPKLRTEIESAPESIEMPQEPVQIPVMESAATGVADVDVYSTNYGITKLVRSMNLDENQKKIYSEIYRSLAAKGYKIVVGSAAEIAKFDGTQFATDDSGMTNVGTKTIYLANPSAEVLVHEFIHAASFEQVLDHYEGRTTPELTEAIKRLEVLMDEFMNIDDDSTGMQNARAAIQQAQIDMASSESLGKAKALNEFMAWSLTNQDITEILTQKPAPLLVRIAKDVIKAIKQMLWGKQRAAKLDDSFLSSLRFNTAIVIRTAPSLQAQMAQVNLAHNSVFGSSDRLTNIRDAFAKQVVDHIAPAATYAQSAQQNAGALAQVYALGLLKGVMRAGFKMSRQEASTFRLITHTLATTAEIDAPALAQAQVLYTHVVKNLTVEDFMADPNTMDPAARPMAQAKYDVLVGNLARAKDGQGRTAMLPVFLALATVNDEFRAVLEKIEVPKSVKKADGTLDTLLESEANRAMQAVVNKISGQGDAKNVRTAIDNLQQQIQDTVADDKQWFDTVGEKVGGFTDKINDRLVQELQKLSNKGYDLGDRIASTATNRYTQFAGNFLRAVSGLATDENSNRVAEGVVEMMNKGNLVRPLREFLGDLIGRTNNNADVYDMIKTTRATIQQLRQNFREEVPRTIASKFSREINSTEQAAMFRALGKTDVSVFGSNALNMFDATTRATTISTLENQLQQANPADWSKLQSKAQQLATYMNSGVAGNNLLRNANAVSKLWGESPSKRFNQADVTQLDQLISLYAVEGLNQTDKDAISSLVQSEKAGMEFSIRYLEGQRKTEMKKSQNGRAQANYFKGYIPQENLAGVSLIIGEDANFADLTSRSFERIGNYNGSRLDRWNTSRGYYFATVSPRAGFNQGILQNVRHTSSGVDTATGFSMGMVAGRIMDPRLVANLAKNLKNEGSTAEPLMPIYDDAGAVVAFERSIDPAVMSRVEQPQNFMSQIGIWRGRQVEEVFSVQVNEQLIDNLKAMYDEDMQSSTSNKSQYVNLFGKVNDSVTADAVRLVPQHLRESIEARFGDGEFWVRKDMLNDAIGYRSATVGDAWTGNTRWNQETQDIVKKLAMNVFGNDAYKKLVNGEKALQNVIGEARTIIVVKSVVVPFVNFMSNIFQLMSRGLPITQIARAMPNKLVEIEQYTKSRLRQVQLEAEIRGATNVVEERKLRAESRAIQDAHTRLSIWPLIKAGEFSSIADVNVTHEDVDLTSGKFMQFLEAQVNKLPDGLQTVARYGMVGRDTALFQGLQKSVQYGDFLAKAVLFDNLTKNKGLTQEQALARITEEFVNYDRLAGRTRSYLESVGLMWFYNFKIRSTKVALSMLRNNPLHSLLVAMNPVPDFFGSVGTPVDDNILSKAIQGSLDSSVGPAMGMGAPSLNPWANLAF